MQDQHQQWLLELTQIPTASGREGHVIDWITRWVKARKDVQLLRDRFGNLTIKLKAIKSTKPLYFEAHLDHPAFVVGKVDDGKQLVAEFRGGVDESYFVGTPVLLYHKGQSAKQGRIVSFEAAPKNDASKMIDATGKWARIVFEESVKAAVGDVLMWDTGKSRIEGDRIFVPACDNLAGVAAALCAFDQYRLDLKNSGAGKKKNQKNKGETIADVRVLLTRAEEVGFIGAIAACKAKTLPKASSVIVLENSRSFSDSPIGAGPIVRVGDRTSTFHPDLTYRIGRVAEKLAQADSTFLYQRKLMPGGTCNASAYQSYGYTASCLCLPLGNYHNMNEVTGRIEAETISLRDFHRLVRLLTAIAHSLDSANAIAPLKTRLEELFARGQGLLKPV